MLPQRLSIMSYALGANAAEAGGEWVDTLVQTIQDKKPAIIALEGFRRDHLRQVEGALSDYYLSNGQRRWDASRRYSELLIKDGLFDLKSAEDIVLDGGRVATVIHIKPVEKAGSIIVGAVELDDKNARQRLRDLRAVFPAFAEAQGPGRRPASLLAGQFYESPNGAVHRILTGRRTVGGHTGSFKDSIRVASTQDKEAVTDMHENLRSNWVMVDRLEMQETQILDPLEGYAPVLADILL